MPFSYQELFPLPHDDGTPWRPLGTDGVSTFEARGRRFLSVDPAALRHLAAEATRGSPHFLRPGHLAQLGRIVGAPAASENDRFVALELLKNANVAAAGVLPSCQDTGTAIVMAKKGENGFTGSHAEAGLRPGL